MDFTYQPVERYRAIMALLLRVCSTNLLKTLWEKDKLLVTSNLSFFPQCFLPVLITLCYFRPMRNFCLHTLSILKSLKSVIWESVMKLMLGKEKMLLVTIFWITTCIVFYAPHRKIGGMSSFTGVHLSVCLSVFLSAQTWHENLTRSS